MAGVSQMAAGSAMLLVGGDVAALAACDDVLAAISDKRIHFGPSGSGAAATVINNAVAHAVMAVVAEAGYMATEAGVACDNLIEDGRRYWGASVCISVGIPWVVLTLK